MQPVNELQHHVVSPRYVLARTLQLDIAYDVSQYELVEFLDCTHLNMPCSEDTSIKLLNEHIGKQRLQLRQQHIALDGHKLCLIQPADVDAVIDMYIAAGKTPLPAEIRLSILSHAGNGPGPHKQRNLHQPEEWLREELSAGQEERDPYWARPWPSALALGRYILEHRQYVQGRSVCEVGAGLGIATIAALLAGQLPLPAIARTTP